MVGSARIARRGSGRCPHEHAGIWSCRSLAESARRFLSRPARARGAPLPASDWWAAPSHTLIERCFRARCENVTIAMHACAKRACFSHGCLGLVDRFLAPRATTQSSCCDVCFGSRRAPIAGACAVGANCEDRGSEKSHDNVPCRREHRAERRTLGRVRASPVEQLWRPPGSQNEGMSQRPAALFFLGASPAEF